MSKKLLDLAGLEKLVDKLKDYADNASGDIPAVIDNLTSTSTTAALSANQGRVLNEKIDAAIQAAIQNTWNGEY